MTSFRSISAAAALTALVIVPTQGFAKLTAPAAQTTPSAVPAGFTAASHGTTPEIKVAPTGPQWSPSRSSG